MKVQVHIRQPEEPFEVEIAFPVYRKHVILLESSEFVIFSRWDEDGTLWSLRSSKSYGRYADADWQIEKGERAPAGTHAESLDYLLGRGEYACTPEEFQKAWGEASALLAEIMTAEQEPQQGDGEIEH